MRKRLYCTLPDTNVCRQLVTELKQAGIQDHAIHVAARDDMPLDGLHQATAMQKTELAYGLELGLIVGGIAGLLGGLLAITLPPPGLDLGLVAVLATTIVGSGFGALVSTFVARDIPNHELDGYQASLMYGYVLLMLDVATQDVEHILGLIKRSHPEVDIR